MALILAYLFGVATGVITRNWQAVLSLIPLVALVLFAVWMIVGEQNRHERETDDIAEDIAFWARTSEMPPEDRRHARALVREKRPELFGRYPDEGTD